MRRRLLVAMVGLVAVVLVAHDVPLARYLRTIERDRLATAMERDAFTLGGRISQLIAGGDASTAADEVATAIANASEGGDGTVVVVDRAGYLVASTGTATYTRSSPSVADALVPDVTRPSSAAAISGRPT